MHHRPNVVLLLAALIALCFAPALAAPPQSHAAKKPQIKLRATKGKRWKLVHSSEFRDPTTAFASWQTQRDDWIKGGIPYSNLEGPHYRSSNVAVGDGSLRMWIGRDPLNPSRMATGSVNARTRLSFRYGYLEARILVPACSGCWPAFWLLPRSDHWPPEIDIFEFVDSAKMPYPYSAVHWPSRTAGTKEQLSSKVMSPSYGGDYTGTWQTYGMRWDSRRIRMYLNGRRGPTFSGRRSIPRQRMYPIMQLAVGAGYSPALGSTMLVDYVRLWQKRR